MSGSIETGEQQAIRPTTVMSILLDEQLRRYMAWVLEADGYAVVDVLQSNGYTSRMRPDVILINTTMGPAEKRACIAALRSLVPGVAIIDMQHSETQAAEDTGADAYLGKPYKIEEMLDRVRAFDVPAA